MTFYKTPDDQIWDDMGGAAKELPSWPVNAVEITNEEAQAILTAERAAYVPKEISRRQFYQEAADVNLITQQEALDAMKTGTLPPSLQLYVDALPTADQQFVANMILSGSDAIYRDSSLVIDIGVTFGLTTEQLNDFFRAAALL